MSPLTGRMLSAARTDAPERFRASVRRALQKAGDVEGAAVALGVHWTTLYRWVRDDEALREGIELRGRGRPTATK